jgi:hypothetical protein
MYFKPIWGTLFLKYSGGALVSFRAAICVSPHEQLLTQHSIPFPLSFAVLQNYRPKRN